MKYALNNAAERPNRGTWTGVKALARLADGEAGKIAFAILAILLTSGLNLVAPLLVGYAIDTYVQAKDFGGVLRISALLLGVYLVSFGSNYVQMIVMGGVGQRTLFRLRNAIFSKLQALPIGFFQANKAGDLISRINNDTDKLNQFFSEIIMRFVGNIFVMVGAAVFFLSLSPRLGAAALAPALLATVLTQLVSGWVKKRNADSAQAVGGMSAEIQENLNNFKVMAVFHRRDYLKKRFEAAGDKTFRTALRAGFANGVFAPAYDLAANAAQLLVVGYGATLIARGQFTLGLVITFLLYVNQFYGPFRQIAMIWSSLQVALAGWDRVSDILTLSSDLETVKHVPNGNAPKSLLAFDDVSFRYEDGKEVLRHASFALERGKTYAFVGPTGGGKTTTASLMARLYDATSGTVWLDGRDIRSYEADARAKKIGFILQEPFLFTGTLRDNLVYGNQRYLGATDAQLLAVLKGNNLEGLLARFPEGLATALSAGQESLSLGQKQLIAFMRALLREPDLLILDEATANIDTVTEQLLEEILAKLPATTTKVIIAHRLNTIQSADEILFVNEGEIVQAGSFKKAVELLMQGKRES